MQLYIRLDEGAHDYIKQRAERNHRTMAGEVREIISAARAQEARKAKVARRTQTGNSKTSVAK